MSAHTTRTHARPLLGWSRALQRACVLVALAFASSVHAHQPAESSADFRWTHGRLELRAVFSLKMAETLLNDPEVPRIGSQNFEHIKERLSARLADAFEVTLVESTIKPVKVVISLAPEGEIICWQVFADATPGKLIIRARFLEKLPEDFYCWARAWFDADQFLGQALLTRTKLAASLPSLPGRLDSSKPGQK